MSHESLASPQPGSAASLIAFSGLVHASDVAGDLGDDRVCHPGIVPVILNSTALDAPWHPPS